MNDKESIFKQLLSNLENELPDVKEEFKYIGTGNPHSKILIIGKETAISMKDQSEQYKREIEDNFSYWKNNQYDIGKISDKQPNNYSPFYPYKGQILKRDNKANWGTSVTWMNYQKLIDFIFNIPNNDSINFHERSFITEVNSTPSKKNANADKSSISFRKKHVLSSDFFQSFPIVIISGVGYFKISKNEKKNEIEEVFGVNYTEQKFALKDKNKQPFWIHWNQSKTKLLINTYQLSINISNDLLMEVAKEIRNSMLIKIE